MKLTKMSSSDWSELSTDVLELIARRLDLMQCFRFGATCKSCWSAAMSKCYQVPWLMLSKHDDDTDAHSFFSLFHQEDCWLKVPELHEKRCCGSSYGWLTTTDYETLDFHLLNPFSRRQIKLPSLMTFPYPYIMEVPHLKVNYIQKAILSEDPSLTDDYILLAIVSGMARLAFFRPQKEGKWIVMDCHRVPFQNIIYFKEQFYAVDMAGVLLVVEIDPQPKITRTTPCLKKHTSTCQRYLVDCSGELLHVRRPTHGKKPYVDSSDGENNDWNWNGFPKFYHDRFLEKSVDSGSDNDDDSDISDSDNDNGNQCNHICSEDLKVIYHTAVFKVYKLVRMNDFMYKWEKVKGIGDYMLFLGDNGSFSSSIADFSESKGNRIYFTDDHWLYYDNEDGCHDIGIFNLEDGTFEQFYPNVYHSPVSPPIWITPNPK